MSYALLQYGTLLIWLKNREISNTDLTLVETNFAKSVIPPGNCSECVYQSLRIVTLCYFILCCVFWDLLKGLLYNEKNVYLLLFLKSKVAVILCEFHHKLLTRVS